MASPDNTPSMSIATELLIERARQVEVEGRTHAADDLYRSGELAEAAACYAVGTRRHASKRWPWPWEWWKPKDRRRNMVRAGALIIAEIERIDRQVRRGEPPEVQP